MKNRDKVTVRSENIFRITVKTTKCVFTKINFYDSIKKGDTKKEDSNCIHIN